MSASSLINLLERRERKYRQELTPKELEVLHLAVTGMKNAVIADQLGVTTSTVSKHREAINKKLNCHHPIAMVRAAIKDGYIDVHQWMATVVQM